MAENFFGKTDVGRLRENNEDAFFALELASGKIAACVIDGVGGYEGGEVAAEIARNTILEVLQQKEQADLEAHMRQALQTANERIYTERTSNPQRQSMACVLTLAIADIAQNQLHYAHVGDTRLYLLRDHSLVKLTKDHSFVGFLEDSKRISEKEAMQHPKRNEINKALGFDPEMSRQDDYLETGKSPFLPGDLALLCSDGLTDLVSSAEILSLLQQKKSLKEKAEALISAANHAGGKDNITVVLIQNHKKPISQKATRPVKKNESLQQAETPVSTTAAARKNNRGAIIALLSIFCLIFLAAAVWFWWQWQTQTPREKPPATASRLPAELALDSQLKAAADTVFLNAGLVIVRDTIFIRQDSLYINGGGVVIRADSAFAGPVFFAANSRFLMLENISFENFTVALQAPARAIQFRNVKFINCKTPLLAAYPFPSEVAVSGKLVDSLFFTIDTIQKLKGNE